MQHRLRMVGNEGKRSVVNGAESAELARLKAQIGELETENRLLAAGLVPGALAGTLTTAATPDMLLAAIEMTRMPMVLSDPHQPDNPIIFANRAFQELSGYGSDELVGRNCRFLQGPDTNPGDVSKIRDAIRERRAVAVDILNYRRDGTPFQNELHIAPVFDKQGELLYFFASQVDLTRYGNDREKLARSEERYKSLFDAIEAGFCVFEMKFDEGGKAVDYRFLEINPAFAAQTGLSDAVGRWMTDLAPEHEQHWFDTYGEVARTRRSIRFENRAEALGRDYEVHAYSVGLPSQNQVAALFADVTARKRAERQLKRLNETLEVEVAERTRELLASEESLRQSQKMEAIGQLTGGVAHDFNNLLTIVRSAAEFLQRPNLADERRQRYVSAIVDTSERAAKLTAQLLAFARRSPLKTETFDVGDRMHAIGELVRPLLGTQIGLSVEGCRPGACFVEADPTQFETALVNLAVNARDAMNGSGQLRFAAREADHIPTVRRHERRDGAYIAVSVVDQGSGISAADIERIFEPFFTTKETGKGTGLGLSQVFGFAKQSGGEIEVASSPEGTTFTLYLPASARRSDAAAVEDDVQGVLPTDACILVVEDNREVGRFSTELLHDLGFRTRWVEDAEAALRELDRAADEFDLVFSDVMMPGMNGVELGRAIRSRLPDMPVILTSGYSDVVADEGTNGFDLVRKPYSLEVLSQALRRAFAGQVMIDGDISAATVEGST